MTNKYHPAFLDKYIFEQLQNGKTPDFITEKFVREHAAPYEKYLESRVELAQQTYEQQEINIETLKNIFIQQLQRLGLNLDAQSESSTLREKISELEIAIDYSGSGSNPRDQKITMDCQQLLNKIDLINGHVELFPDLFYACFFHEASHQLDDYLKINNSRDQNQRERFAEGLTRLITTSIERDYENWKKAYESDQQEVKQKIEFAEQITKTIGHNLRDNGIFSKVKNTHPNLRARCNARAMLYEPVSIGFEPYLQPFSEKEIKTCFQNPRLCVRFNHIY